MLEFFTSSIPYRIQMVAIVASFTLLGVVIHLIRKEKLKEGYSIVWFIVGITLVLFSIVTRLLDLLARAVGISYSPAALFIILSGGLVLLALHFSVLVSKHDKKIRELAQEHALLKEEIQELKTANTQQSITSFHEEKYKKDRMHAL